MLSGRGIDGELKSKFGEWSEKFWQSSSWGSLIQDKNFQAIYLASEGGEDGSGGKTLSELKGNDGQQMISTESDGEDKVKKFFGICVGESSENGCKNAQGGSVVLVGDDPKVSASMTWEKLKSQDWGDQASLVRFDQSYGGLFKNHIWKGNDKGERSSLNGHKLQTILRTHRGKEKMTKIFVRESQKIK